MRNASAVVAGVLCGIVFGAFVFEVNNTIGRYFLHFIPVYWCTTIARDGTESYCWAWGARAVDWLYLLAYMVPTTLYAFTTGFDWGRRKASV